MWSHIHSLLFSPMLSWHYTLSAHTKKEMATGKMPFSKFDSVTAAVKAAYEGLYSAYAQRAHTHAHVRTHPLITHTPTHIHPLWWCPGLRPSLPPSCPSIVTKLISRCWYSDPDLRQVRPDCDWLTSRDTILSVLSSYSPSIFCLFDIYSSPPGSLKQSQLDSDR